MFSGTSRLLVVCHPALSRSKTACAPSAIIARDFVEVKQHRLGVGVGQGERRADAARRTDRAEQIGVVVTLIGRLARPRPASRPLPNLAVLLADAGLVLEPDLDRRRLRQAVEMGAQRA